MFRIAKGLFNISVERRSAVQRLIWRVEVEQRIFMGIPLCCIKVAAKDVHALQEVRVGHDGLFIAYLRVYIFSMRNVKFSLRILAIKAIKTGAI